MTREEMWKEFENQLIIETRTPITVSYDASERMTKSAIEETVAKWKERLEQEPCNDVVSRNAIIQTLNNMDRYVANELKLCDTNNKFPQNEVFVVDDVYEQIVEQLPSVTPTQRWIPCKLRLPEEYADVICCTDAEEIFIATYLGKMNDGVDCFDDDNGMMWEGDVIAWQSLPQAYKESEG